MSHEKVIISNKYNKEVIMPKGYNHVTQDIRSQIFILKATGKSLRKISKFVCLDTSTISREIKRNIGERGYRYKQADVKAVARRMKASRIPKKLTSSLIARIEQKALLNFKWVNNKYKNSLSSPPPTARGQAAAGI